MTDHQVARPAPLTPGQLKALAHPIRFRMLDVLQTDGPATATGLGRIVGESSGTTSYHLRQLASAGLIAEDPDLGSGRDRWWRATRRWSIDLDLAEGPATRADAAVVLDEVLSGRVDRLRRWQAESSQWGRAWRDATVIASSRLSLTPDEMTRLGNELVAVVERYAGLHERGDSGTASISVQTDVFPTGSPIAADPAG